MDGIEIIKNKKIKICILSEYAYFSLANKGKRAESKIQKKILMDQSLVKVKT